MSKYFPHQTLVIKHGILNGFYCHRLGTSRKKQGLIIIPAIRANPLLSSLPFCIPMLDDHLELQ